MGITGTILQLEGALPVVSVLLGLILVVVAAYAVRDDAGYQNVAQADDEIVCPRCHHSTGGATEICPECGKDL